jgi:hypothetical protein
MHRMRICLAGFALLSWWSESADGQALLVASSPAPMIVAVAPAAGAEPLPVSDNTTTYTVSAVPLQPQKITAQISANMPPGVTLTVSLAPPTGARAGGPVVLDNVARDVVNGVTNADPESRAITYQLMATVSAGVISTDTRTVTLTLVNDP